MPTVFPWGQGSALVAAILIASLLAGTLVLVYVHQQLSRLLGRLEDKREAPSVWRAPRVITRARRTLRWTLGVSAVYGCLYASTWAYEPLTPVFWTPALTHLPTVAVIGFTLVLASLLREAVAHLDDVVEARARRYGKKANRQIVHALQIFLRYAISIGAAVVVIGGLLDILGFQGDIAGTILGWFTAQAGALILLATLIGIGWVGGRVIRATASEVRYTSTRLSPKVVDAMGGFARGVLYAVLGIVGLITLLQSVGLGSVGGTLVVVLSSFVGITVAMAGTGSIGNALSGVVLLAFRPLDKGDRVVLLDDMVCDVEEVTLMFTRVRTLANERVDVPNNQVLSKRIRNLSQSQRHAIVVKLGIGYDVSHNLVRSLALQAAKETPGILSDPAPEVYVRDLANYAMDYELYAYTDNPRHMKTKSELLGRLQDTFYAVGVEIMTPDVYVIRKGRTAEPEGPVRVAVTGPLAPEAASAPTAAAATAERER